MTHTSPFLRPVRTAIPLAFTAMLLLACGPVPAQDAPAAAPAAPVAAPANPDAVVATVGDEHHHRGRPRALPPRTSARNSQNIPPEQRRAFLVTVLIDMKVMARRARARRAWTSLGRVQAAPHLSRGPRAAPGVFRRKDFVAVTPRGAAGGLRRVRRDLPAAGRSARQAHPRRDRRRRRGDQGRARGGKPFEVLAMEKSIDPSGAQNGGDLGFFCAA